MAGSEYCTACSVGNYADQSGQEQCKPCGAGTTSTADGTSCENTCTYRVPGTEIMYNLTSIDRFNFGPYHIANSSLEFFFSLCNRMNTSTTSFCRADDGSVSLNTYACVQQRQRETDAIMSIFDTGHIINYLPNEIENRGKGFLIFMQGASKCPQSEIEAKTFINMKCNTKAGYGEPVIDMSKTVVEKTRFCEVYYNWDSIAACPTCGPLDYDSTMTSCKNGKRKKVFFWISSHTCFQDGSLALPQEEEFTCPICTEQDYFYMETSCKDFKKTRKYAWLEPRNCSDGALLPSDMIVACGKLQLVELIFSNR